MHGPTRSYHAGTNWQIALSTARLPMHRGTCCVMSPGVQDEDAEDAADAAPPAEEAAAEDALEEPPAMMCDAISG